MRDDNSALHASIMHRIPPIIIKRETSMKRKFICGKKLTAVALSLVLAASPAMSASPVFADEAGEQKTVEASLEAGSESNDSNAEEGAGVNKEEKTEDNKLSTGSDENKDKSENEQGEVKEEKKTEEVKTENSKTDDSKEGGVKAEGSEVEKKDEVKENSDAKKTEDKTEGEDADKKAEENASGVKDEEADLEAVMQKVSKLIESLPSVDEIKTYGNDSEKLAKVNSILNDIAELTETNGIELTDEQTETLTAVADAVNEASLMTLETQEEIEGKEVEITKDTEISEDTTASLIIPEGADVTLKINPDATLENIDGKHTITVKSGGKLSITGGGAIDNISHARAALEIEAGGTAVINGATLTRSKENGKNAQDNGGNSYYVIRNHGNLTIENATVRQDGQYSSMIENGYQNNSTENTKKNTPTLNIENGKFYGGLNTIKNDDAGILHIYGGEFTNVAQNAVLNANIAEISGGTFTNTSDNDYPTINNLFYNSDYDAGELYINNDPTINGYISSNAGSQLSVEGGNITGGIFAKKGIGYLLISDKLEKDGCTFIGWFDHYTGNEYKYTDDLELTENAYFMPVFIENKVNSNSAADVPSDNAADTTVNDAVAEIIKNNGSGTSDVEIKTDKTDLGSEIKSAIAAGTPIGTQMDLSSISEASLPEAELKAIKELAGNGNIALFTDISIGMTIGGSPVANITKLPDMIDITMDIPAALQSGNRSFSVIRMHDGKAELLPATVIAGGTKIKFQTDKFSTYALVYTNKSSGSSGGSDRSRSTVNNGSWVQDNNGWWFKKTDGSYPKDQWFECTWNGTDNWYHFNANGYADCGWFTDKDGQKYFLHDQHDGKFGFMYTGWNMISGQWYYFNTAAKAGSSAFAGASKGSLVTDGMTPDGFKVDANGAWVK